VCALATTRYIFSACYGFIYSVVSYLVYIYWPFSPYNIAIINITILSIIIRYFPGQIRTQVYTDLKREAMISGFCVYCVDTQACWLTTRTTTSCRRFAPRCSSITTTNRRARDSKSLTKHSCCRWTTASMSAPPVCTRQGPL